MGSRGERDKTKQLQDKCQAVLNDLLRDDDNKYCVDCDSKGPRWASWNIGVFLCIRCAGIHRNLGVHISKVKSVNLDTWTPEQVGMLQEIGNSRARAVYEANLPDNFRRPQNDSSLESFIRAKYEHKKYIASEWVPPTLPKVNWDKEIDEEMEKQKRKKKAHVEKKSLVTVEVPQIPKPKVPSPKPNRIVSTPEAKKKDGDLLGLQNGDDSFSGFLSASTTTKPEDDVKADSIKSEEESFFNQTIPTEKEKVKLTKDSILALYGSAPPMNQLPYQQSNFGAQAFGNNFPQQPQQVQQNFAAPLQNNGAPGQFAGMQWPNQWANKPQPQFANQFAANQFQGNQLFQNGQFPPIGQTQNGQAKQPGFQQQFASFPQAPQSTSTPPNPFFANQNNLQQQFGNLGLTNQASNATLPTLSTNIWQ